MTSARRQPRRYAELVHRIEDGKPAPLEVGCWVVVSDKDHAIPLTLAQLIAGPHHQKQADETIAIYWQLHDGTWRPAHELTRLDLAGVLSEAAETLAAIRSGGNPEEREVTILRVHRAACLARRAQPTVTAPEAAARLAELVTLDVALADHEQAWRDMMRTRLPNLARALAAAGALELARQPSWTPGEGRQHPGWIPDHRIN